MSRHETEPGRAAVRAAPHRFGVTPLLREAVEQAVAAGGDQVGLAAAA